MEPSGTVAVSWVGEAAVTAAKVAPKYTMLSAATEPKLVPVMITELPTFPEDGVIEVMVGGAVKVKLTALVTELQSTVTLMSPVVAPAGTITCRLVAVAEVTVAAMPLILTVLLDGVGSKLVPVIATVVPTGPPVGENPLMVGGGSAEATFLNTEMD